MARHAKQDALGHRGSTDVRGTDEEDCDTHGLAWSRINRRAGKTRRPRPHEVSVRWSKQEITFRLHPFGGQRLAASPQFNRRTEAARRDRFSSKVEDHISMP